MSSRAARVVAGCLLGVLVGCVTFALLFRLLNGNPMSAFATEIAVYSLFTIVGVLIIARQPENAVGWVYAAIGLLLASGEFAVEYAAYTYLTRPGVLPAGLGAAWYAQWYYIPFGALILVFIPLLFPTGRPLSRRWHLILWLALFTTIILTALNALYPSLELRQAYVADNPAYVAHNPIGVSINSDVRNGISTLGYGLQSVYAILAFVSLVVRFRRSKGAERQQLKWFTYAGVLIIVGSVAPGIVAMISGILVSLGLLGGPIAEDLANLDLLGGPIIDIVLIALLPIATGVAILRYRLYDIDLIIRRTLIYSVLSAALVLTYLGIVVLLQQLLRVLTGQDSAAAIVISTLAIAALFNPLRQRIQAFIDRRFYRRKYDAQQTLAAFGQTVRNEVELDKLTGELVRVIDETMQPAYVSIWLREPEVRQ